MAVFDLSDLSWCDTHCHLDACEFHDELVSVVKRSRAAGVREWIIPAVATSAFERVLDIVTQHAGASFALGIHPLYVGSAKRSHIEQLEQWIKRHRSDKRLVAVGEIGLDLYPGHPPFEQQQWFFEQQLRLAKRYELPVIVHARRAADQVYAGLKRFQIRSGVIHAFNGSEQQALALIGQGMLLGFGGSLTYEGSRRIRRLAASLPLHTMLLETDSPDIRPRWFSGDLNRPNEPSELAAIAACLAQLRAVSLASLSEAFAENLTRLKSSL